MKAMTSEMDMYQTHMTEYKIEIDRLNKDLTETKKRFFN